MASKASKKKRIGAIGIAARNVYNLTDLTLELFADKRTVTVGGPNGAGKSNVLALFEALVRGAKGFAEGKPILKAGEQTGEIIGEIGDIWIRRRFKASGAPSLVVEEDGQKVRSKPQERLNRLLGAIGFDPGEFDDMSDADQIKTLGKIAGVDLDEIAAKRKGVYDERTEVNRSLRRVEAEIESIHVPDGTPDEKQDIAELQAEAQRRREIFQESERARAGLADKRDKIAQDEARIVDLQSQIDKLQAAVEMLKTEVERDALAIDSMKVESPDGIDEQIRTVVETNAAVEQKKNRADRIARARRLRDESDSLTQTLDKLDREAESAISKSKLPDGVTVRNGAVYFQDEPLRAQSDGNRLRINCAIGAAGAGELPVFVFRNGAHFDKNNLAAVGEIVEEFGGYALVERVGEQSEAADLIIEAGEIVEDRREKTTAEPAPNVVDVTVEPSDNRAPDDL